MDSPETPDGKMERLLGSIVPPSPPPGLRERVLRTAREKAAARAWTTPALRKVIWACSLIIGLGLIGDAVLGRQAVKRVQALVKAGSEAAPVPGIREKLPSGELADIFTFTLAGRRKVNPGPMDESREIEQIEKESADGLELSKDLD